MKKIPYSILVLLFAGCSNFSEKTTYEINGSLAAKDSTIIYLQNFNNDVLQKDSTYVLNGKFEFKGKTANPMLSYLYTSSSRDKRQTLAFILENAEINIIGIEDSLKLAKVSGSKEQEQYEKLQKLLAPLNVKFSELNRSYRLAEEANDSINMELIDKEWEAKEQEYNSISRNFISENPKAYASLIAIDDLAGGVADVSTLEPLLKLVDISILKYPLGIRLTKGLEIARNTEIGKPFTDFHSKTRNNQPFIFSSVKSKYILLDFWASWCGPCRAENPGLVKAYNKFHSKGLEIVSISLDDSKEDWEKAIQNDELNWIHASTLIGFKEKAASDYGVRAIPQNFLIDEKGIIIAKDLRGEELEIEMNKILN